VMLSMDFKRIWQSSRQGARPLSVWRPVGPPGYSALGDVAMPGREPPARPVTMYRDVAQQQVGIVQCCRNCSGCFAGCSHRWCCHWALPQQLPVPLCRAATLPRFCMQDAAGGPLPAVALPERFQLVFRDSGGVGVNAVAISIWRPVAPRG
jgi:hypothetical protein